MTTPAASPMEIAETDTATEADKPWLCLVWDDPVNLMSYVTYVFQMLFGMGRQQAHDLMLKVHNDGKAVVTSGDRDKVESDVKKLHKAGLWATMQRSD
ncbi:ATP-dependent Clp protease adapter ClpS [Corynebacterium sputi]|uniref:ATP-dependent Clp protease adapter ClpS n=1 Tax=Corynebacterium sputi TaxID=489915 RepID=UPI00047CBEC8|nr:ATP-dependent Clp protease adapter ClpS [Corynebacterium sputi]